MSATQKFLTPVEVFWCLLLCSYLPIFLCLPPRSATRIFLTPVEVHVHRPDALLFSIPVEVFLGFLGVRLLNFFNPSRSFFFRESVAQKIFNPRRSFFRSSLVFLWPILVYFRSFMVYPLNIIFNPSRSFVCYNKIFNPSRSFLGSTPLSTVFLFLALLEVSWSQLK